MKKSTSFILLALISSTLFSGCASSSYDTGYYGYETSNDRAINRTIAKEMNSLSDADIAALNKLK